jgi:hypothetical protein
MTKRLAPATLVVTLVGAMFGAMVGTAPAHAETSRSMMLELHGGGYTPDVDSAFDGATPWADVFGSDSLTMLRMHLDYQVWQGFGSLAIGAGIGYGWIDGKARDEEGEVTDDPVGFNLAPLTLSLVYRWDWAAVRHGVPLVPYVKAGLTGAFWWTTDAKDSISNTRAADGQAREGSGLTLGWHVAGGLMFLLDVFSAGMAAGFDNEAGVNNSYLFVEYHHSSLDDFGSSESIVLTDSTLSFGLAFEF